MLIIISLLFSLLNLCIWVVINDLNKYNSKRLYAKRYSKILRIILLIPPFTLVFIIYTTIRDIINIIIKGLED